MSIHWLKKMLCHISWHGIGALVIIGIAAMLRLVLIWQGWPGTNSDEGTFGLMALHIAYQGDHPIFMYGQNYMGTLEAYLGAGFFHLFGPSLSSLRLGMVLLFSCFLLIIYRLANLLYTKNIALLSILLLSFGTDEMLHRQLMVVGGALETLLFGALSLLLVVQLALSLQQGPLSEQGRRPYLLALSLGLVVGLGIWSHALILPYVLMVALFLFLFCRCLFITRAALLLCVGLVLGLLPLIIYNIADISHNSLSVFLTNFNGGSASLPYSWGYQFLGTLTVTVPMAIGANPLVIPSTTPGAWQTEALALFPQAVWSLGFLALWGISAALTVHRLSILRRSGAADTKPQIICVTGRLMLLGGAGLTLLAYLISPTSAVTPVTSYRYLTGMLIAMPAIIASLVPSLHLKQSPFIRITAWRDLLRVAALLLIFFVYIRGTITLVQDVPTTQAVNRQHEALIHDLLVAQMTHVYADYWTCNWLIFESHERIICSYVDDNFHVRPNRYPPYAHIVQQDRDAPYIFALGSSQDHTFPRKMPRSYRRTLLSSANYVIYQLER